MLEPAKAEQMVKITEEAYRKPTMTSFWLWKIRTENIHLLDYPFIGFPLFFFVETTIQISIAGKEPFFFFIGT